MATDKHASATSSAPLEARIAVLEELFMRLAQAGATECILENGFKTISDRLQVIAEQMAPLRSLGPGVPQVATDEDRRLRNLEAALISPQRTVKHWNGEPSEKPRKTLPDTLRETTYDLAVQDNQRRTAP
jgi:hypothetical protein